MKTKPKIKKHTVKNTVFRHFVNNVDTHGSYTYGTCFISRVSYLKEPVIWTAGHVMTDALFPVVLPKFADDKSKWSHRLGGMDISVYGLDFDKKHNFRHPEEGLPISVFGYPAGSRHLEYRKGFAYIERFDGKWIGRIDSPHEPVVSGMSGGMVIGHFPDGNKQIGVLATSNSPTELTGDNISDFSFDFVSIARAIELEKELRAARRVF